MVDGVVLAPLDQPEQVRELQRDRALVLDQSAQARREAADVGHVGKDVVPRHQVGPAVPPRDIAAGLGAQELDFGGDPAGPGGLGHVRGGLDAEDRDAGRLEVLQKVAVVAGYLGDQAVRRQRQALDHRLRVPLGVRHPRVRIRGKVSIVGEDILAGHISGELHEQACVAQADMEWIEHACFVEFPGT